MKQVATEMLSDGFLRLERRRVRFDDGGEQDFEIVGHPGAVAIVAHDEEDLYLVRQPRPAVGEDSLLELAAGTLDVAGEGALHCARRELVEELGLVAGNWNELGRIYSSPGTLSEQVTIFLATDLAHIPATPEPGERIEIVRWPIGDLDGLLAEIRDAKTVLGLLLWERLRAPVATAIQP